MKDTLIAKDPGRQVPLEQLDIPNPEGRRTTLLWKRLGRHLHVLSQARFVFWILAFYFQFITMFLSSAETLVENLSKTLLMYGVAMSFESLRDSSAVSQERRHEFVSHKTGVRWSVTAVFVGGLFSIATGFYMFFAADSRELGWAITTFGLGMLSLGRQHYDQLNSALSETLKDPPNGTSSGS